MNDAEFEVRWRAWAHEGCCRIGTAMAESMIAGTCAAVLQGGNHASTLMRWMQLIASSSSSRAPVGLGKSHVRTASTAPVVVVLFAVRDAAAAAQRPISGTEVDEIDAGLGLHYALVGSSVQAAIWQHPGRTPVAPPAAQASAIRALPPPAPALLS